MGVITGQSRYNTAARLEVGQLCIGATPEIVRLGCDSALLGTVKLVMGITRVALFNTAQPKGTTGKPNWNVMIIGACRRELCWLS